MPCVSAGRGVRYPAVGRAINLYRLLLWGAPRLRVAALSSSPRGALFPSARLFPSLSLSPAARPRPNALTLDAERESRKPAASYLVAVAGSRAPLRFSQSHPLRARSLAFPPFRAPLRSARPPIAALRAR